MCDCAVRRVRGWRSGASTYNKAIGSFRAYFWESQGESGVQVAKAVLDLCKPAELSSVSQDTPIPSVALASIHAQVNRNAQAAARRGGSVDGDGDVKMEDGEETADEKEGAAAEAMSLETVAVIVDSLVNSEVMVADEARPGHFWLPTTTPTFMVRPDGVLMSLVVLKGFVTEV